MTILFYNTIGDYMKTIKECYSSLQTIQKSEFIANIYPVSSIEEINDILAKVRKKYYDATHNCYAYVLGVNANIVKASDDGEPSQTAGVVIYDVLKKNELTNVLAIVTRYFGGIKLGAGGLVRAYSKSVKDALGLVDINKLQSGKLTIGVPSQIGTFFVFDSISKFHKIYPNIEITIISSSTKSLLKKLNMLVMQILILSMTMTLKIFISLKLMLD